MPLLDHFQPPWSISHPWMGVHSAWATSIVQQLNHELPEEYYAVPNIQLGGQIEIDVATLKTGSTEPAAAVATAVWAPPKPAFVAPIDFTGLDVFEVQVFQRMGGPQLRAAIELVSPANKDRPSHRQAFAIKCASYLQRGVAVVVVDVVTERRANLNAELLDLLKISSDAALLSLADLSAVSYRAVTRGTQQLEIWPQSLGIGQELPEMPLWIDIELCIPLRLEESYLATCETLRIR